VAAPTEQQSEQRGEQQPEQQPEQRGGLGGLTRAEIAFLAAIAAVTVLAGFTRYAHSVSRVIAFAFATLALAGMAWIVALATEQVGERLGPAATGLMQSTVGNLPEFFVVIFALNAGQKVVAETAILGSILVNALLVLGLVIVAGALREQDGVMRFSPRLPNDTATLLLVASFIIVLVGLTHSAGDAASHHSKTISIIGAVAILIVYATWLRQYLTAPDSAGVEHRGAPRVALTTSIALLVVAGTASALVSDWFVNALQPTINITGAGEATVFEGTVLVASFVILATVAAFE
jgi:Ca2+:H+ antiporter